MVVKKFVLIISFLFVAVGLLGLTQIVRAQTLKDLVGQVNLLQDQLNKILEQTPRSWCYSFQNDLSKGAAGPEVRILQAALEQEGFVIASREKMYDYFGTSTTQAVIGFQEKYQSDILAPIGLTTGTGYLGSGTRTKLNQLFDCPTITPVIAESQYKCPDINGDGQVEGKDVGIVNNALGTCMGNTSYNPAADMDGDGCITQTDASFVGKFFGQATNTITQCGGIPRYSLTIAVNGQGTTSPAAGTYAYQQGEQVTISAMPTPGWDFSSWQGADNNSTNPTTVTITANKIVTALFQQKPESEYKCPNINGDGKVDGKDLGIVNQAFGTCIGNPNYNPAADMDGDGCITQTDTNFVGKFFGQNPSQIAQCKTTSSLQTLSSMIASMTEAISKIVNQLRELLK